MKNKLTLKGFTLIELLVVIAIIGLLSTIIAAPVQQARKKAKDTKKVAELKAVQSALELYYDSFGQYPKNLRTLEPTYIQKLPATAVAGGNERDRFRYTAVEGTLANTTTASVLSYHLGVHLETVHTALQGDADCKGFTDTADVPAAAAGNTPQACDAATLTTGTLKYYVDDLSSTITTATNADDISGINGNSTTDTSDNSCAPLTACVFDLAAQN